MWRTNETQSERLEIDMSSYPIGDKLIAFIKKVSLFYNAQDEVISRLAGITVITNYKAQETIINNGAIGHTMYIIFSGTLKVHDDEHQVALLEKGEFFGELSILDSEPRSMSVSAVTEATLGSIDRKSFYEVLEQFPEMTKYIIAALNKRLRGQNEVLISEFKSREEQLQDLVISGNCSNTS